LVLVVGLAVDVLETPATIVLVGLTVDDVELVELVELLEVDEVLELGGGTTVDEVVLDVGLIVLLVLLVLLVELELVLLVLEVELLEVELVELLEVELLVEDEEVDEVDVEVVVAPTTAVFAPQLTWPSLASISGEPVMPSTVAWSAVTLIWPGAGVDCSFSVIWIRPASGPSTLASGISWVFGAEPSGRVSSGTTIWVPMIGTVVTSSSTALTACEVPEALRATPAPSPLSAEHSA
jgi:hypothetical protein